MKLNRHLTTPGGGLRRRVRPLLLLLPILALVFSSRAAIPLYSRAQVQMGTYITLSADQPEAVGLGFQEFARLNAIFSNYQDDSEVSRLNQERKMLVSKDLGELILMSENIRRQSRGAFNIGVGRWTNPAHRQMKRARPPLSGEIRVRERNIELTGNLELDFGGIAKGFAVDRVRELWREKGVKQGQVAASGDIRCLGSCLLSIRHPLNPDVEMLSFESKGELGISTSGSYERKGSVHLLDPRSGKAVQPFISVSLFGEMSNAELDAWATAIAVSSESEALELLNSNPKMHYLLVTSDRRVLSDGKWDHCFRKWAWDRAAADLKITQQTVIKKN